MVEEEESRDCFKKYYAESNLSPLYLEKAEYNIHTHGTSTGTVTIILNDAGDMIRWSFGKVYNVHMTSVGVVLADPNVCPDELADF